MLKECKSLSDFLQSKDCDIVAAINLVETTRDLFNQMHESDTGFTSVWKASVDVATKIGADIPTDSSTPVSYTHLDVYKRQSPGMTL